MGLQSGLRVVFVRLFTVKGLLAAAAVRAVTGVVFAARRSDEWLKRLVGDMGKGKNLSFNWE
ncbi:hypothetical protein NC651_016177 [Populus alba x Populus x berolinensis]|nr:hypothetical protein NC651_016177 [Populus alba x Populus x berolinensis]